MRPVSPTHRNTLSTAALAAGLVLSAISAAAQICNGVSTASGTTIRTTRIASGLTKPCCSTSPVGDTHRVFILEQDGRIRIVKDGLLLPTPFLDVRDPRSPVGGGNEQGLLGLAFSPSTTPTASSSSTTRTPAVHEHRRAVSRLREPDVADTSTARLIIVIPHPATATTTAGISVRPDDGMLYIGFGDGGGGGDPRQRSQQQPPARCTARSCASTSVPKPRPPHVPARSLTDNRVRDRRPTRVRPEIYAYGLRNPWRW